MMWSAVLILACRLCLVGQLSPMLLDRVGQMTAPTTAASSTDAPASAQAVSTSAPTSQPATADMGATPGVKPKSKGFWDVFEGTHLGRLFEGKDQLSLQEVAQVQFWVGMARELILAALSFIPRVFIAVLFMFIFWIVYRAIRKIVLGSMKRAHVDQSIRDMLGALIKWSVMGFGLVIACNQVGIEITALLTGVSIIGLAIGFAAQETLANFIAGVVIFWDKPFKVGDWVTVDTTFSQVQRVTFRSTRLLTLDGQTVVFPNTFMLANKVLNHSAHPINRIQIPIGISYAASIDNARAALLALTTHDSRIVNDPPPAVVVEKLADSSVNLNMRFWIRDESQEQAIFYEYTEKAKKALDAAGIEIPFPHVQLMLEQTDAINTIAGKAGRAA